RRAPSPPLTSEAREGGDGGGGAGFVGAVGGREEIEGTRFAGEEQPVVDGGGELGASVGMAGQRVGIGAAGEFVLAPERGGERLDAAAYVAAEQPGQFVGREGDHRVEAVAL